MFFKHNLMQKFTRFIVVLLFVAGLHSTQAQQIQKIYGNPFNGYSTYLDRQLDSRMDEQFDPGIGVSIIRDGQVRIRNIKGVKALSGERELLTPNTSFYLASVTKPMTAQIIRELVNTDQLDINANITDILPGLPDYMKEVTVEHLVNHQSGITNFYEFITWREPLIDNDYVLGLLKTRVKELEFTPGSKHSYSNSNYVLLAEIIEQVSGKTYHEVLESVVVKPNRMIATSLNRPKPYAQYATGYNLKEGQFLLNDYEKIEFANGFVGRFNKRTYGSSGVFSTQSDLERWILRLNKDGYFDELPQNQKEVDGYEDSPVKDVHYSLGWYHGKILGQEVFWHSGEFGGYRNLVLTIPEADFSIVALSNNGSLEVEKMGLVWAEEFLSRLNGQ